MKDDFFSRKIYWGTYEPVFKFSEFGDTQNYWISLKYYVNRDDYQTQKNARGTALDFSLKDGDGNSIFGELSPSELQTLQARNYVLGAQKPQPANEEKDLLEVEEIYIYAPNQSYEIYDSAEVPVYGVEDVDLSATANIVFGASAGHVYYRQIYGTSILEVDDASNFKTGDEVCVLLTCKYRVDDIQWVYNKMVWKDATIAEINGNLIEFTSSLEGWDYEESEYGVSRCTIAHNGLFFYCMKGGSLPEGIAGTLSPLSGVVAKAFTKRKDDVITAPIREKISYSLTPPMCPEPLCPKLGTGERTRSFTRSTIPTAIQWKTKIENGDWYQYCEAQPTFDKDYGIYELRIKETKCR